MAVLQASLDTALADWAAAKESAAEAQESVVDLQGQLVEADDAYHQQTDEVNTILASSPLSRQAP